MDTSELLQALAQKRVISIPVYCTGRLLGHVVLPVDFWQSLLHNTDDVIRCLILAIPTDPTFQPRTTTFELVRTSDGYPIALNTDDESKALRMVGFSRMPVVDNPSDADSVEVRTFELLALMKWAERLTNTVAERDGEKHIDKLMTPMIIYNPNDGGTIEPTKFATTVHKAILFYCGVAINAMGVARASQAAGEPSGGD